MLGQFIANALDYINSRSFELVMVSTQLKIFTSGLHIIFKVFMLDEWEICSCVIIICLLSLLWHGERKNYHVQMHLAFIQNKKLEIVCNPKVTILKSYETQISCFKDSEVVYSKSPGWSGQKAIGSQVFILDGWEVRSYDKAPSSSGTRVDVSTSIYGQTHWFMSFCLTSLTSYSI